MASAACDGFPLGMDDNLQGQRVPARLIAFRFWLDMPAGSQPPPVPGQQGSESREGRPRNNLAALKRRPIGSPRQYILQRSHLNFQVPNKTGVLPRRIWNSAPPTKYAVLKRPGASTNVCISFPCSNLVPCTVPVGFFDSGKQAPGCHFNLSDN